MNRINPSGKILGHVERMAGWYGKRPAPITVEWDLSNRCDLGCEACHFGFTHTRGPLSGKRDKPGEAVAGGDVANTDLVIKNLHEMSAFGVRAVVWSGGGEPTLHPDFDAIISSTGMDQGLYTHGGHIDAHRASFMFLRMKWVVVSLDCLTPQEYAAYKGCSQQRFHAAVAGITNMASQGTEVGVSFLLGPHNHHQAEEMAEFSRGLGASYSTFRPLVRYDMQNPAVPAEDTSWVTDALPMLERLAAAPGVECLPERFLEYRDWKRSYTECHGIKFTATISPNGKVWICPNRREHSDSCLGDLNEESFEDIWGRHPGHWTDFEKCRVMCRMHMVNKTVAQVYVEQNYKHRNFI